MAEKKIFTYRGKTIDELKTLDVREFSKYLKSRARRNALRQFQDIESFVNRANKKTERKKNIRTHKRDLIIVPAMVGMKISIYDGKNFVPVEITGEMLGHKFGEFAPTRGKVKHSAAGIGATKGSKSQAKK
ncbi:MAG TPA: ribosomal protein S19 family protein [Patescibacteria group bacterium]|nr:ribosomal protein S19 family protein [Patescibacteria group bacterium]